MEPGIRIGIDIGGTFTDFVIFHPASGNLETFKLLSTPDDPAKAVITGLVQILKSLPENPNEPINIVHGSTVATNALLERKGARTALITTSGFRDIIQIGRQNRPELYNFFTNPTPTLIPKELRLETVERIGTHGEIITPMNPEAPHHLKATIASLHPESIAICLLFSFTNPVHEQKIAEVLRNAGYSVSVSSEILPEYREYERMSTTVVNAYVSPVLQKYLNTLEKTFTPEVTSNQRKINLRVMQSNGGIIHIDEARKNGVRCILSGPAGGVIAARRIIEISESLNQSAEGSENKTPPRYQTLTFDMGGTSTDVSLIDGEPKVTTEAVVGGYPIRVPVLDIHTIGAGGGSIATVDAGGVLRVGPDSAGANPGPACYGKGDLPTVTDANLVLGRLQAEYFLGGQMKIDYKRAQNALEKVAGQLNLDSSSRIESAALGVIEIVNAHMERALRVISVERGHDPQDFSLLSFGGAGGLHAADLARSLKIPNVLIPPLASTLSAFGMLNANLVRDYTHTVMLTGSTPPAEIETELAPLANQATLDILTEGISPEDIIIERMLDMRYRGQSYEITIPFTDSFIISFHEAHEHAYGTSRKEAEIEIVNVRVRATGVVHSPQLRSLPMASSDPKSAYLETRRVWFGSGEVNVPLYRGEALLPANKIMGPAIIIRSDTTILIGLHDQATVDGYLNILIDIGN